MLVTLKSRKFWGTVIAAAWVAAGTALNLDPSVVKTIAAIIMTGVIGQAIADAGANGGSQGKKIVLLVLGLGLLAIPARADKAYELGGSFDPSTQPRFKGTASLLQPLDAAGSTLSYTSALFNKAADKGSFSYTLVTGIRRRLPLNLPLRITPWLDLQGGVSTSGTATSGAFLGGGVLTRPLHGRWYVFVSGKAFASPAGGGVIPQVLAGAGYQ